MLNIKRSLATLLAVVMVIGSMSTVAFAASGSMKVYVDSDYTGINTAYIDRHDDVYVESWEDLRQIFPDELDDQLSANPDADVLLEDWADEFGYSMEVKNNKVYLYSDGRDTDYDDPIIDEPDDPDPYISTVRVYRNGKYVSSAAYTHTTSNEDVYVNYPQGESLKAIFGTVPKNIYAYTTLKQWAGAYGYYYYRYGNDVFLNNDGKTPIVVMLDGERVNFPDQQPIVLAPGYTMIPVYSLGEMLGYDVTWVGGKFQRVDISNSNHTITLYIGYSFMRHDGKWQQIAVAPIVTGDRTLVPARFVVEAFGLEIKYDNSLLNLGGPGVIHIISK